MAKVKRAVLDVRTDVKGRMGGLARAKKLTASQRSEIARNAANKRWKRPKRVRIEIK